MTDIVKPATPALDALFAKHGNGERFTTSTTGVFMDQGPNLFANLQSASVSPNLDADQRAAIVADLATVPVKELVAAQDYEDQVNHMGAYALQAPMPAIVAPAATPVAALPASVQSALPVVSKALDVANAVTAVSSALPPSHPSQSHFASFLAGLGSILGALGHALQPVAQAALPIVEQAALEAMQQTKLGAPK